MTGPGRAGPATGRTTYPRLHPALDGIALVVFDKDGTLIEFDAMWAPWARQLAAALEQATGRRVAPPLFELMGFDPETGRTTITMDLILEVFGQTLAGESVSGSTRMTLDFCVSCGGCS